MYKTSFSTKDSQQFENYFKNISQRLKDREKENFNHEIPFGYCNRCEYDAYWF